MFSKDVSKSCGLRPSCKNCTKKTKDYNKHYNLNRSYGITKEYYDECMSSSDKCGICGTESNLCYDHDHTTMKFRGVLCTKCNTGIGMLGDALLDIENALMYMRKHYD
jgi:hypothetical protein